MPDAPGSDGVSPSPKVPTLTYPPADFTRISACTPSGRSSSPNAVRSNESNGSLAVVAAGSGSTTVTLLAGWLPPTVAVSCSVVEGPVP